MITRTEANSRHYADVTSNTGIGPNALMERLCVCVHRLKAQGIVAIRDAAPSTETILPLAGGTTVCTVRGRTISCSVNVCDTFSVAVVLSRFLLISRTLLCMTLVTQVVLPSDSLTIVS